MVELIGVENLSFSGSMVAQNLTVIGDLSVSGSQFIAESETFQVEDNLIRLNSDAVGVPSENCGIEVKRGSSPSAQLIWDESTDLWKIGVEGNLVSLLRLTELTNFINSVSAPGTIVPYAGSTAPTGWLLCDGAIVASGSYPNLAAILGSTYNIGGEGAGNFRIPDLRQRFPIGKSTAGIASTLGERGGTIDHSHTLSNHDHTISHTHPIASHSHGTDHAHTVPGHYHSPGNLALTGNGGSHAHEVDHSVSSAEGGGWGGVLNSPAFAGNLNLTDYSYSFNKRTQFVTHQHTAGNFSGVTGDTFNLIWEDGDNNVLTNYQSTQGFGNTTDPTTFSTLGPSSSSTNTNNGSTTSNNPPFLAVNYIIKY